MDELFTDERLDPMWQRQFDTAARMPLAWLLTARQLWKAAEAAYEIAHSAHEESVRSMLQEMENKQQLISRTLSNEESERVRDISLFYVYSMLIAFTIENLAKGILIAQHAELVMPSGAIAAPIKSHDLSKLCTNALGNISDEEKDVLDVLSDFAVWRGRYPIPLNWHEMKPRQTSTGVWIQPSQGSVWEKRILINSILERLWNLLQSIRFSGNTAT